MTGVDGLCDICGYGSVKVVDGGKCQVIVPYEIQGVCSVPSFPVSLAHCNVCLSIGVFPMFCLESIFCDFEGEGEEMRMLDLDETIVKRGVEVMLSIAAPWFLEGRVWVRPAEGLGPGRPEEVAAYLRRLASQLD